VRGLSEKPRWVRALAWCLWANVLGMPVQVMVLYGHPPSEFAAIWAKIPPQNQLVMALSALAALGVHRVARWGWYAVFFFAGVGLWNNWVLLHFPTAMPRWTVAAASTALAVLALAFLRPAACRLFHTQSLHWWRAAPRYRVSAPVELHTGEGEGVVGTLFNLSRTGLFVEADLSRLHAVDTLRVRVRLEERVLSCRARVVRRCPASATYPEGLGLRFASVPLADRLWLRTALSAVAA